MSQSPMRESPMRETADAAPRVDRSAAGPKVRAAKSKIAAVVLVCAKCQKRQGVAKRAVRDLIKRGLKRGHPKRKVRIVETGCLGPCPKRALAVATGASLASGRILLLDPAATPDDAVATILPDFGPKAALARSLAIPAGRPPGA
jgi:hypothetical protein